MYHITITKEEDVTVTSYPIEKRFDADTLPEGEEQYGPMPHESNEIRETQLLDQRVDNLDMEAVIIAVNRIGMDRPGPYNEDSGTAREYPADGPEVNDDERSASKITRR